MDSSKKAIKKMASSATEILSKATKTDSTKDTGNTVENKSLLNNTEDEESLQFEWEIERTIASKNTKDATMQQNWVLAIIVSFVIFCGLLLAYLILGEYFNYSVHKTHKNTVDTDTEKFGYIGVGVVRLRDVRDLKHDLRQAFGTQDGKALMATAVRLVFNDCSGPQIYANNTIDGSVSICDGCIDGKNKMNLGLYKFAIQPLEQVFIDGAYDTIMSRTDFWIAAATIAIQYAAELKYGDEMKILQDFEKQIDGDLDATPQPMAGIDGGDNDRRLLSDDELQLVDDGRDKLPSLPLYFGRIDCTSSPYAKILNDKEYPSVNDGWKQIYQWFETNFGFDVNETIAIMGAHTLGSHLRYTGIAGNWVNKPNVFDNEYYELMVDEKQKWHQQETELNDGVVFVNENGKLSMFNCDISLAFNIDEYLDESGKIDKNECDVEKSKCAKQQTSYNIVKKYATDNQQFYNDFAKAWEKMILIGYNKNMLTRFS